VAVVADTGAIYDSSDTYHLSVCAVVEREPGSIYVPVAILAEIDYLLLEYLGPQAELDFLKSIDSGAFTLEPLTTVDFTRCLEIIEQYRDLKLGLADAAVMATAERLGVRRILTLDERDFRAVLANDGQPFILLPSDESP
jgi:predicted nucleic acid-binding protein